MDISTLDKALATLESQVSGVEQRVDSLEKWLWLSSIAVIIGVALEIYFVILEYRENRNDWARGIVSPPDKPSTLILWGEIASILLVVLGIAGELGIGILSSNANSKLRTLNNSRLQLVREQATEAITQSGGAKASAVKASEAAEAAVSSAKEAKQQADAFKGKIESALKLANEAESHLNDALAQAGAAVTLAKGYQHQIEEAGRDAAEAKSLLTEARQLALEARSGVARIQTPRSLRDTKSMSRRLAEFKATEYTFSGVCPDKECTDLLKTIDGMLMAADWKRVKPPGGFPSINVYGSEQAFSVPESLMPGIRIVLESTDSLSSLQAVPLNKLPRYIQAAVALRDEIVSSLLPVAIPEDAPVVNRDREGGSQTIRIAVGRKP